MLKTQTADGEMSDPEFSSYRKLHSPKLDETREEVRPQGPVSGLPTGTTMGLLSKN